MRQSWALRREAGRTRSPWAGWAVLAGCGVHLRDTPGHVRGAWEVWEPAPSSLFPAHCLESDFLSQSFSD